MKFTIYNLQLGWGGWGIWRSEAVTGNRKWAWRGSSSRSYNLCWRVSHSEHKWISDTPVVDARKHRAEQNPTALTSQGIRESLFQSQLRVTMPEDT